MCGIATSSALGCSPQLLHSYYITRSVLTALQCHRRWSAPSENAVASRTTGCACVGASRGIVQGLDVGARAGRAGSAAAAIFQLSGMQIYANYCTA